MTHPTQRTSQSIALARAAYHCLLRLYPLAFRQRFGHEMDQFFHANCRAARQERGVWGVCALWLATLPDILMTATKEHGTAFSKSVKEFHVQAATVTRLGGIMAFVAVFFQFIVAVILIVMDTGHKLLPRHAAEGASQIVFVLVLVGLAAAQHSQLGRWLWGGIAAFILVSAFAIHPLPGIPGVLMVFAEQGSATPLAWSALYIVVIFIAMAVASIAILRTRTLGRWSVAPLLLTVWMALSVVVLILATSAINTHFQGQLGDSVVNAKGLRDSLVVIPGWLLLLGTGVGLLHTASVMPPQPAAQPADAVQ